MVPTLVSRAIVLLQELVERFRNLRKLINQRSKGPNGGRKVAAKVKLRKVEITGLRFCQMATRISLLLLGSCQIPNSWIVRLRYVTKDFVVVVLDGLLPCFKTLSTDSESPKSVFGSMELLEIALHKL